MLPQHIEVTKFTIIFVTEFFFIFEQHGERDSNPNKGSLQAPLFKNSASQSSSASSATSTSSSALTGGGWRGCTIKCSWLCDRSCSRHRSDGKGDIGNWIIVARRGDNGNRRSLRSRGGCRLWHGSVIGLH